MRVRVDILGQEVSERLGFIDAIKGFAIILVVIGHAVQFSNQNFDSSILFRFIYSFHMPLFMFVGGFLIEIEKFRNCDYIIKKFSQLVVPYIFWLFVMFVYMYGMNSVFSYKIIQFFLEAVMSPDAGGMWYLLVLFNIYFITYLIITYSYYKFDVSVTIVIIGLNIVAFCFSKTNILCLKHICWFMPFFYGGFYYRRYVYLRAREIKISYSSLIAYFLLFPMWRRPNSTLLEANILGTPKIISIIIYRIYNYLVGFCAVFVVFNIFHVLYKKFNFKFKALSFLGKKSLEIYVTHFYFVAEISVVVSNNITFEYLKIPLISVISLCAALIFQSFLKLNRVVSMVCFGKI